MRNRKVPLRLVLVMPFVLQIFAAVGLTGYLSLRNGQKAVNEVTTQLRSEITARIQQHLNSYLLLPHLANQSAINVMELGLVNPQDFRSFERYYWKQIQSSESINTIQFGSEQGEYIGAGRLEDGSLVLKIANSSSQSDFRTYATDEQGNPTKLLQTRPDYNPKIRPWYRKAVQTGQTVWSPIYVMFSHRLLGITLSEPVYDDTDGLVGVVGTDILLSEISEFLRSLRIGKTGQSFILERSGFVVASSTQQQLLNFHQSEGKRLKAANNNDLLIQSATQYLTENFGNLNQIKTKQRLKFQLDGERQFLQVTPFQDGKGLDWLIVLVVPETDFMGQINANTRTTILLCLAALVLATLIGIFTSRWIARPILRLIEASRAIASGALDQKVEGSGVNELEVLAQSFNQMAAQLKDSFNELEIRVEQRTLQMREAKEAADAANKAKSEFLANMSHELRTPLNAILGFAQLMERDSTVTAQQRESLGIINRSGEHLLNLIDDVLEMSKIEAGRTALQPEPFDLHRMLQTLKKIFQIQAEAKQLSLQFDLAPDLPRYINSDEGKLRQALINLLSNAVKFTQTGKVTLRVRSRKRDEAIQNYLPHPSRAKRFAFRGTPEIAQCQSPVTTDLDFEVEDTGRGIAPEERDRLFEPFVQTVSGLQSEGGTGLGLAISREFVRLMGGELCCRSTPGQGSTFSFQVKATLTERSQVRKQSARRRVVKIAPDQPTYRILIVDGQQENCDLLVQLLANLGFQTRTATNGREAIAVWQQWQPHLIWMDMGMPVMDGYAATRQIRAQPQGKNTVIVALTATAFEEQQAKILAVGCNDFVGKPFCEQAILEKIAEHLGVRYIYAVKDEVGKIKDQKTPSESKLACGTSSALQNSDFCVMPAEWVAALHQAAIAVDAELIFQLIEQIPEAHQSLAQGLAELTRNYGFDEIIALTQVLR